MRFEESVRGCDAFVLQSHSAPINKWIMEQLIMVDALKRASAKRITVVIPFYGYARQDKKHRGREPISARLMADLFKTAGADRLMAVDLHTVADPGLLRRPGRPPVRAAAARRVRRQPDRPPKHHRRLAGRRPGAGRRALDRHRSARPLAFIHKRRDPMVPNEVEVHEVVGDVEGRTCVLVDDMIDTGGTIVKAAEALFDDGAADVIVAATHGDLLRPGRRPARRTAAIAEVVVTNTLPIAEEQRFDKLTVLSIAPLLGRAIREVFDDGSVTSLFDGHA